MVDHDPTHGIEISAEFVPFSRSRNRAEPNASLNWLVTISANGRKIVTDYMQGLGHLPGYKHGRKTIQEHNADRLAAETGRRHRWHAGRNNPEEKLAPPSLDDVLSCLLMDSSAIDAGSFEYWAGSLGYDTDSRAAEKMYNDCISTALQLRAMLGNDRIEELRTHYQDR